MKEFNLSDFNKKRILIDDVFKSKNKTVEVAGWVHNSRDLSKVKFIILRDFSGIIQITGIKGKTNEKIFKDMEKIPRESVIYVSGKIVDSKQAPGGKEINPEELIVINKSEELPIDVPFNPSDDSKTELPKRLDYRFLDLHRKKIQAIFKIQSEIANSFREYFYKQGFVEVFLPSVISSSSEGGTDLFEVRYFEQKAYLAQSPQLYKQMLACSPLEKVFTITPVWRAEKHNTIRHLNESRQMDIEVAFANQQKIMEYEEEVVKHIIKRVVEKCGEELKILKVNLKIPKAKYLSYDEAVKLLKIKHGEDFSPENEKELDKKFPDTIVFAHSWPASIKPFYIMPKDAKADAKLSEGFDAIYKGLEITSGGQRIHIPELLEKRIKAKGLNPKHFKAYIDSFRFGAPPHAGWSIGLERLTQLIVGEKNIREAVLFPRDRDRLTP
ncbi:aspartate--tRNA(Asn) ligase [Candidatus Pacearchaeota archaeon]|nr:aspartate--tRNA(Asn) ligase [Candidatus Pacearchaeota archaeon]